MAKLNRADLTNASLIDLNLTHTDLREARLRGARLHVCRMFATRLNQLDLSETDVGLLLTTDRTSLFWNEGYAAGFDSTTKWSSGLRGLWMRLEVIGFQKLRGWAFWPALTLDGFTWYLAGGRDSPHALNAGIGIALLAAVGFTVGKIAYELNKTLGEDYYGDNEVDD